VVNEYDILSIHLARPKYIIYLAYSTLIYYKQNTNRIDWWYTYLELFLRVNFHPEFRFSVTGGGLKDNTTYENKRRASQIERRIQMGR